MSREPLSIFDAPLSDIVTALARDETNAVDLVTEAVRRHEMAAVDLRAAAQDGECLTFVQFDSAGQQRAWHRQREQRSAREKRPSCSCDWHRVADCDPAREVRPAVRLAGDARREDEEHGSRAPRIRALDHAAIPLENVEPMIAFYRALGFTVREGERAVSVHFGDQKINFHRPAFWRSGEFTLRAPKALPPCGDFCWVWEGTETELAAALARAGAEVVAEGERIGGRDDGTGVGQSTYTRDPDGNLLEFIRYP